jgi:hypothetical protein
MNEEIDEFDYEFYLEKYEDLRYMTKEDAYYHWTNYGMAERRKCNRKNAINYETNITIMVHLFFEELFGEFLEYIQNVKEIFNKVNVIFTISENSTLEEKIKMIDNRFVVIKVENKGVDIYPFLESIRYMRSNFKTDFVLKIHSKVSSNEMHSEWRKRLISPITNPENLKILQHYFKKLKNIGYVGAQSCCLHKNYDKIFPQNIKGLQELCEKFPHLPENWTDFLGGTMFWISNEALNLLTDELIDYIVENVSYEKPPCNLTDPGIYIEYVCERLFTGVMCYDKTNILINEEENIHGSCLIDEKDGLIDNSYYYSPKVFSIYQPKNIITS